MTSGLVDEATTPARRAGAGDPPDEATAISTGAERRGLDDRAIARALEPVVVASRGASRAAARGVAPRQERAPDRAPGARPTSRSRTRHPGRPPPPRTPRPRPMPVRAPEPVVVPRAAPRQRGRRRPPSTPRPTEASPAGAAARRIAAAVVVDGIRRLRGRRGARAGHPGDHGLSARAARLTTPPPGRVSLTGCALARALRRASAPGTGT